ncbi:MAG: OmpL47-type beta-barrel domain-containing protein, partial [Candidatus Thorarchaeota archaeon]
QGYSLDEKANHTILGNTTIPIPDDGVHSIQVFGNNSIGAIYQSVLRYFSIDITTPIISINNPYPNEFFGNNAPNFEISIDEPNLNTTWYTIDNGLTNKTFTGFTGTINQTEWGKLSNGSVIIHFYANDTWGFEGNTKVGVWKDTYAPTSSILFVPYSGFNIVNETTEFSLIAGDGIGSGVSTIRYKINDSSWITYIEPFNLSSYDYGVYIITYQAIDNVGNIETENIQLVELIKEPGPSEPTIHGYNLWIVIGIISIISAMVISKRIKK